MNQLIITALFKEDYRQTLESGKCD